MTQMIKTTIDQSAYYLLCLRLLKSVYMIKFMLTLIVFILRLNAALEKATVLSIQLLQWLKNGNTIWIKVDQFGYAKGLFTDLSKAFDRLVHDFLIAKLMVLLMSL